MTRPQDQASRRVVDAAECADPSFDLSVRALARFEPKVNKCGPLPEYRPELGPCWIWTKGTREGGYGQFYGGFRRNIPAHRWSYRYFVGPIPSGFEVDHLCRVRLCVNPAHLEATTVQVNRQRRNEAKTHCTNGHEYEPCNTGWQTGPDGYTSRYCKACDRAKHQRQRDQKRGAA